MMRITDTVKHLIIINVIFFIATEVLRARGIYIGEYLSLFFIKNELFQPWQFVTTMFMHASYPNFQHILFNMLALWMFGSALEQMWGKKKFLFFYFSAGIGASLIYTLANYIQFHQAESILLSNNFTIDQINRLFSLDHQTFINTVKSRVFEGISLKNIDIQLLYDKGYLVYSIPAVGASGAIMGLLVAYGMLFPNAQLMLLFPPIPIKAKYFIPALIGLDLFSGLTGVAIFSPSNTAYWAHLGGAFIGFVMMMYWKKTQFNNNRWN